LLFSVLAVSHATYFLKPLKVLNVINVFHTTGVCTLHVSTNIGHLHVSLKLLSLVRITEEVLEWKSSGSGLENRD
jgi:hypothetical protein